MKCIYLGYDEFDYCLDALMEAGHEVVAVYSFHSEDPSEKNVRLRGFAEENGIPFSETRITREDIVGHRDAGAELLLSAGYIYRIPVVSGLMTLNFHPAPLPVGRGPWPFPVAILRGCSEYGAALHKIAESFDTGDIVAVTRFPIRADETTRSLILRTREAALPMLRRVFMNLRESYAAAMPQIGGEYWGLPTAEELTVTEQTDAVAADRIRRAKEE